MTNREKYFLKRDPYDLLMDMWLRIYCPVEIISGKKPECPPDARYASSGCGKCIQEWLNEESEQQLKPEWQKMMMKNFLRKE